MASRMKSAFLNMPLHMMSMLGEHWAKPSAPSPLVRFDSIWLTSADEQSNVHNFKLRNVTHDLSTVTQGLADPR
ncbi:hypothetical protein VKT23_020259 [Stygiomarasmius scandens]|uniref:Uncharacterized protein n=1 Tax=Marasmiellus scandens TaxID=2682957 RepID=A0ABR1IJE7_9AGAR